MISFPDDVGHALRAGHRIERLAYVNGEHRFWCECGKTFQVSDAIWQNSTLLAFPLEETLIELIRACHDDAADSLEVEKCPRCGQKIFLVNNEPAVHDRSLDGEPCTSAENV